MKKIQCPGNPLAQDYSRREFLYVGMLGSLGLTLPQFLKMEEAQGALGPNRGTRKILRGRNPWVAADGAFLLCFPLSSPQCGGYSALAGLTCTQLQRILDLGLVAS